MFQRHHTAQPAAFLLTILVFLALVATAARASPVGALVAAPEMDQGGLFLPGERPGYVVPATQVATDVTIEVSGMIARARVVQRFENPTDRWTEGVYVFPLPETAAVDRLRMVIGGRIVEGEIQERETARQAYEEARDAGQQASLVSQERPNLFTNAVANIAPHDSITVEIEYQQSLDYDAGTFNLTFPTVVLPRYIPGTPSAAPQDGTGWAYDTDQVPDASRITPPVAAPGTGPVNPVSLTVELDAGFPLGEIESPSHPIMLTAGEYGRVTVTLATDDVWADRDFRLRWQPDVGAEPNAGVFSETLDGARYHLVLLVPPTDIEADGIEGREVVFVIDTSGSMAGDSIVQARQALLMALDRLRPQDRFNVVAFNSRPRMLFEKARPANAEAVAAGREFVRALEADGGTEMAPALWLALHEPRPQDVFRQVVFITDGAVGNEAELFGLIGQAIGTTRLFTVGIGSAPNAFFMREAAAMGRGTFTFISSETVVGDRMEELFARLEQPALTDIDVDWGVDAVVEFQYPSPIPDLYVGEPVVATARLPAEATTDRVVVTGQAGGRPWRVEAALDTGAEAPGVAALWARNRITDLERDGYMGRDDAEIRAEILEVALAHQIVSRVTSLVAIDSEVVRPPEEDLETDAVATNMPDGVDMQMAGGVEGDGPEPALGPLPQDAHSGSMDTAALPAPAAGPQSSLDLIHGMAQLYGPAQHEPVTVVTHLPSGATPQMLNAIIGGLLIIAAALLFRVSRRRTRPVAA